MYTKPVFDPRSIGEAVALIQKHMFATMVASVPEGLVASHLPFLIDRTRGKLGTLCSHLARANAHALALTHDIEQLVIFQGPHGYISSSWYPAAPARDSAPTWNFAAVHCRGKARIVDDAATAKHLHQLVKFMESGRPNYWRIGELGDGGMERRLPHVVGFEIEIAHLDAKFKMGQDERLYDTQAAIEALADVDPNLAQLMQSYNSDRHSS